jgi:hypothetical protein
MWPFGWFSDLREVATTLDRARMVSRADDDLPIDEARSSDGEVAKCASLLRQALPRASARHHRPLNRELAGLLRRLGPEDRLEADRMYRRLRAEDPSDWATHWNHALLLKHSGRFDDALAALDAYRSVGGAPDQAFNWNTGICATGAGLGEKALDAWLAEHVKIALADDGMPSGGFPDVQVRISSRGPLGGPSCEPAADAPDCEYGWVRPRSPCHGVLLTPLTMDEPTDVGDVLLWDGAPVRFKEFDGRRVATFPLLKVLARGGYRRYRFRAEQEDAGLVAALEEALPRGAQLYVHDEEVAWLCHKCAASGAADPHMHDGPPARRLVSGKLVVPPGVSLGDLRERLSESLRVRPAVRLAVPALHRDDGDLAAAARDEALWVQLRREVSRS